MASCQVSRNWGSVHVPFSQPYSLVGAKSAWRKEHLFLNFTKTPYGLSSALWPLRRSQEMLTSTKRRKEISLRCRYWIKNMPRKPLSLCLWSWVKQFLAFPQSDISSPSFCYLMQHLFRLILLRRSNHFASIRNDIQSLHIYPYLYVCRNVPTNSGTWKCGNAFFSFIFSVCSADFDRPVAIPFRGVW